MAKVAVLKLQYFGRVVVRDILHW